MEAFKPIVDLFKEHVKVFSEDTSVLAATVFSVLFMVCFVPFGSKFFVKGLCWLHLIEGTTMLLFPEYLAKSYMMIEADGLHLQENRLIGIVLIALSMTYFLTSKSTDSTVHSSILWSMTLMNGTLLILEAASLYSPGKDKQLNSNMQNLAVHNCVVWFLAALFYSVRQENWGGYMEVTTACRNTHLRIDFVLWLVTGVFAFVFPRPMYELQVGPDVTLGAAHAHYARILATGFMSLAIMSGRASNFLREEDKKSVLLSHALACVLFLITMGLCQLLTTTFSLWHAYFGMTTVFLTFTNAVWGCEPKQLAMDTCQLLSSLVPKKQDKIE